METLLLSPNTAAQKPGSQQGIATTQSEDSGEFSPVMDEAVANVENAEKQQDTGTQENTEHLGSALWENTSPGSEKENSNISTLFANSSSTVTDLAEQSAVTNTVISSGNIEIKTNNTTGIDVSIPTSQTTTAATTLGLTGQVEVTNPFQSQSIPQFNTTATQPVLIGEKITAPATSKVESVLLQQIQQILDQGKENGTIVIRGNELPKASTPGQTDSLQNLSNPLLADAEKGEIQAKQIGIPLTTVEDTPVSTQKSAKLESAHQGVSEQYFNAKLDQSKDSSNDNSAQNNNGQKGSEQQNKPEIQAAITSPSTTAGEAKPGESSFGPQLGQISPTTTSPVSIEGKFAPGVHTAVPEKEMVDNLIQRFNVNPRLQTSKLTMQLHPAELGALKIDIVVKHDSITANIVAQSQQVLETIEKHMPRLRATLEDQGFKIDAFEIAMDGDSGNQKELFQEQFSSQQQEFSSKGSSSRKNDSFSVLLDSQEESEETDEEISGVNLTV